MPLPEKVYYMGLRRKAGISQYREDMNDIMRNLCPDMDREAEFIAIETKLIEALSRLSYNELLQVWATELAMGNKYMGENNKRAALTHVKTAYEVVCWENSPVMIKLGVSKESDLCEFMDESRLKLTKDFAEKLLARNDNDGNPVFRDIHEVLSRMVYGPYGKVEGSEVYIHEPIKHKEATGVDFFRCKTCQARVLALGVGMTRKSASEAIINQAKRATNVIGTELRKAAE